MANKVKISFTSNPTAFYLVWFRVYNDALGYSKTIAKTFVTGIPASSLHVQIGATLADSMINLLANLNANELDGIVNFSVSGSNGVFVNFVANATWSVEDLASPTGSLVSYTTETITVPEPETLPVLDYKHISIRIYDTYINERILIQELASANACKIDFNGGDDLYKALSVSKLVFNMAVLDAQDAKFLHLFSGDEKRYRVEVVGINEAEDEQLLWKGFLLPDQYNEPYKQVLFFVDFTATDMLGSLKGKYLPPWYYQQTLPIAKVLAYCLENTGLAQNIVVKPSVVPEADLYTWEAIGVNMLDYVDGDKYKDCYEILEGVVSSNIMTLYSFRGYWWLEGVHRRAELSTTNLQFDTNGDRIADLITTKELVDCGGKLQPTPNFTALTPWKQVSLNFKANGTKNLFSDEIVRIPKSNQFYSKYKAIGYPYATPVVLDKYGVVKMKKWNENLNNQFEVPNGFVDFSTEYFAEKFSALYWIRIPDFAQPYNYTEAMVMNLYVECPEKPYVKPGNLYEFQMDFTVDVTYLDVNLETFKEKIVQGYYDKLVPFQIFINDQEKYSNRPSFTSDANLRYVAQYQGGITTADHKISFKLNFNFYADVEGYVKVRFLMPINRQTTVSLEDFTIYRVICNALKLTLIEDYDENTDTVAVRPINFTTELPYELKLTSTVDNSIINSMSIGYPLSDDYFFTIDRTINNSDYTGNHYFLPNVNLELLYNTFSVPLSIIKYLFENKKLKTLFLEKENGEKVAMSDFWFINNNTETKIAYLKSYEGFPVIPKKYKAYPDVTSGDTLKYMHVQYAPENYSNRLRWKLVGSTEVDTFPKTVAKALHGVQPETIFKLEASAMHLLWPCHLVDFYFNNEDKVFIPTTLNLDLFGGKTSFVATESKFTELTDISYE